MGWEYARALAGLETGPEQQQAFTWWRGVGAAARLAGSLLPLREPPKGLSGTGSALACSNSWAAACALVLALAARGVWTAASAASAAELRERGRGAAGAMSSMELSMLAPAIDTLRAPFRKARRVGSCARPLAAAAGQAWSSAAAAAAV